MHLAVEVTTHAGEVVEYGQLANILRKQVWFSVKLAEIATLVENIEYVAKTK